MHDCACDVHAEQDQLSELMICMSELYVDALASNPYHATLFPASELAQLNRALQKRDERQVLLSTRSRRVLSKMEASRVWKVSGEGVGSGLNKCQEEERVNEADADIDTEAIRSFFERCSSLHAMEPLALVTDWVAVHAVFDVRHAQVSTAPSMPIRVRVSAWSPVSKLVQGQLILLEESSEITVHVSDIRRPRGLDHLVLLESGSDQATAALLVEVQGVSSGVGDDDRGNHSLSTSDNGTSDADPDTPRHHLAIQEHIPSQADGVSFRATTPRIRELTALVVSTDSAEETKKR